MAAIAENRQRILLTLATGTGKTFIAFQVAWKLFLSRWNLSREPSRRPRILFLADRNILADQAYNAFSAFPEDALVRIEPEDIRKKGRVPKNGSLFFTIFQTFMSGPPKDGHPSPYFGEYPPDFFDFVVIDECHRGGANDESNWRGILDYFAPAVQLGLTATPKRKEVQGGRTAEFAYNHIVCAPMLLWLAEAAGVPTPSIRAAKRAALEAPDSLQSMSAAIRSIIPFAVIAARIGPNRTRAKRVG